MASVILFLVTVYDPYVAQKQVRCGRRRRVVWLLAGALQRTVSVVSVSEATRQPVALA
jgi:hypothetical protein